MRAVVILVALALGFGCAAKHPPRPATAGHQWRIDDGACETFAPPRCGIDDLRCREMLAERNGDVSLELIKELGQRTDRESVEELVWIKVFDDERVYPGLLVEAPAELHAQVRERRQTIESALLEAPDSVVDVALAMHEERVLTPAVLAAASPVKTAARMRGAIACADHGPDATLVSKLIELPDDGARAVLRELALWPAWDVQAEALAALGASNDPIDIVLRERIRRTHWSAVVRAVAVDPDARSLTDPATRRLDHGGASCSTNGGPVTIRWRGELREVPRVAIENRTVPETLPIAFVVVDGEMLDLRAEASVTMHLDPQWLVGVNRGEFASGLFVVDPSGKPQRIDSTPVIEIVDTKRGVVVISGTNHLSVAHGRVMGIDTDAKGHLIRRHRMTLPATPTGVLVEADGTVIIATDLGVVALAPDDTATMLACE